MCIRGASPYGIQYNSYIYHHHLLYYSLSPLRLSLPPPVKRHEIRDTSVGTYLIHTSAVTNGESPSRGAPFSHWLGYVTAKTNRGPRPLTLSNRIGAPLELALSRETNDVRMGRTRRAG